MDFLKTTDDQITGEAFSILFKSQNVILQRFFLNVTVNVLGLQTLGSHKHSTHPQVGQMQPQKTRNQVPIKLNLQTQMAGPQAIIF